MTIQKEKQPINIATVIIILALLVIGYFSILKLVEHFKDRSQGRFVGYLNSAVVVMETSGGDIKFELFKKDAPLAVENFLTLAKEKFYNNTEFHLVRKGLLVQGGDPNSKDTNWSDDGLGGPGYTFKDEINNRSLKRGSLVMANNGPNTNGSQFFILTAKKALELEGKYTVFGRVLEGMDIVNEMENVPVNKDGHPLRAIIIQSIRIL